MIRLQDIAEIAGVSRTTVSNVIQGRTKRVSQKTIDKITKIIDEQGYVPNMASMSLTGNVSKIIGIVTYSWIHGMHATMDSFVGEFIGTIAREAEEKGYYIMLIGGEDYNNVVSVASAWNMDGLIILGYSEKEQDILRKKLNKKMVLVDTYASKEYTFQNVGVDDYSGGYQIGEYLRECGYKKAVMFGESDEASDYYRWLGFKKAMEEEGGYCSKARFIVGSTNKRERIYLYEKLIPQFLEAKAVAFTSDYTAIEAMNFFHDLGIKVPEQISVAGFDNCISATLVRPRLTTVNQDVSKKARTAFECLLRLIRGEELAEKNIRHEVNLIKRESVKDRKNTF